MANKPGYDYGFDGEEYDPQVGDEEMDEDEHDFQIYPIVERDSPIGNIYPIAEQTRIRSGPVTPTGRPVAYPSQSKRRRPLSELNRFSPYLPHSFEPPSTGTYSWYEHTDNQIRSLIDSQKKMMSMFEKVSERIGDMEKVVTNMQKATSPTSSGASPEENKRIPTHISVCFKVKNKT